MIPVLIYTDLTYTGHTCFRERVAGPVFLFGSSRGIVLTDIFLGLFIGQFDLSSGAESSFL